MEILESRNAPLRIIKNHNSSFNQVLLHTPHSIELLNLSPLQYPSLPPFSIESRAYSLPHRQSMHVIFHRKHCSPSGRHLPRHHQHGRYDPASPSAASGKAMHMRSVPEGGSDEPSKQPHSGEQPSCTEYARHSRDGEYGQQLHCAPYTIHFTYTEFSTQCKQFCRALGSFHFHQRKRVDSVPRDRGEHLTFTCGSGSEAHGEPL